MLAGQMAWIPLLLASWIAVDLLVVVVALVVARRRRLGAAKTAAAVARVRLSAAAADARPRAESALPTR